MRSLVLLFLTITAALAWSDPLYAPPAPFSLNDKISMCEVNDGGRVVLKYDVRPLCGTAIKLQLFPGKGKDRDKVAREFIFQGATGTAKLNLKGLPLMVYKVLGTPLNAQGQELVGGERPVFLCWGGGRAWRAYDNPTRYDPESGRPPPPFVGIDKAANSDLPGLELDPPGVVVNRGQTQVVEAIMHGIAIDEPLDWTMEGNGEFKIINNRRVIYKADKGAAIGKNATIHVVCRNRPELHANLTVIVTSVNSGEIQR